MDYRFNKLFSFSFFILLGILLTEISFSDGLFPKFTSYSAFAESLDKEQALKVLTSEIKVNNPYQLGFECLSFLNVKSNSDFHDFIVHEKTSDKCSVNSESNTVLDRFRINRKNYQIQKYEQLGKYWLSYKSPQLDKGKVPVFIGFVTKDPSAFNSFINNHVGKTVYLEMIFEEGKEPIGYRSGKGIPFFEVTNQSNLLNSVKSDSPFSTYFIQEAGDGQTWKRITKYDERNRQLSGFFRIDKSKKTNQKLTSFDITYIPQ